MNDAIRITKQPDGKLCAILGETEITIEESQSVGESIAPLIRSLRPIQPVGSTYSIPIRCAQCGLTQDEDPHEHGFRDHAFRFPEERDESLGDWTSELKPILAEMGLKSPDFERPIFECLIRINPGARLEAVQKLPSIFPEWFQLNAIPRRCAVCGKLEYGHGGDHAFDPGEPVRIEVAPPTIVPEPEPLPWKERLNALTLQKNPAGDFILTGPNAYRVIPSADAMKGDRLFEEFLAVVGQLKSEPDDDAIEFTPIPLRLENQKELLEKGRQIPARTKSGELVIVAECIECRSFVSKWSGNRAPVCLPCVELKRLRGLTTDPNSVVVTSHSDGFRVRSGGYEGTQIQNSSKLAEIVLRCANALWVLSEPGEKFHHPVRSRFPVNDRGTEESKFWNWYQHTDIKENAAMNPMYENVARRAWNAAVGLPICDADKEGLTFTCPKCGRTSYNPNDAKHRWCGACNEFFVPDSATPRSQLQERIQIVREAVEWCDGEHVEPSPANIVHALYAKGFIRDWQAKPDAASTELRRQRDVLLEITWLDTPGEPHETVEQWREQFQKGWVRRSDAAAIGSSGEVCSVCNWTNNGCLNLGNPGEKPEFVCHGCIKRAYDELKNLRTYMESLSGLIREARDGGSAMNVVFGDGMIMMGTWKNPFKGESGIFFRESDRPFAIGDLPADVPRRQKGFLYFQFKNDASARTLLQMVEYYRARYHGETPMSERLNEIEVALMEAEGRKAHLAVLGIPYRIGLLGEELKRFREGKLTPDEINNLCHTLDATVPVEKFCEGCEKYQIGLYGRSPIAELRALLTEADATIVRMKNASRHAHSIAYEKDHGDCAGMMAGSTAIISVQRWTQDAITLANEWTGKVRDWKSGQAPETAALKLALDACEMAWALIANAGGGEWSREGEEWQQSAIKWRETYTHKIVPLNRSTDASLAEYRKPAMDLLREFTTDRWAPSINEKARAMLRHYGEQS